MQHSTELAEKWANMSFDEQMSNIGAEVERALKWKQKKKDNLSYKALVRSLELIDLTRTQNYRLPCLKELSRTREVLVDFIYGTNTYRTNPASISKFFYFFNLKARRDTV